MCSMWGMKSPYYSRMFNSPALREATKSLGRSSAALGRRVRKLSRRRRRVSRSFRNFRSPRRGGF